MPFDRHQSNLTDLGYLLAEASANVVFVVGAGLSIPAGIPSWLGLCDDVLEPALRRYLSSDFEGSSDEANGILAQSRGLQNLWHRGDFYRAQIPEALYRAEIQSALDPSRKLPVYDYLWVFRPSGVINFNLDECAQMSLGGMDSQIATAHDPGRYKNFLLQTKPFLLHPHGVRQRPDTWVLGASERNRLLNDTDYRRFVIQVLGSRRLVVLGFQPDDFAFQSLLIDDFRSEFDGPEHFWITSGLTPDQEAFSRLYHLKPILYEKSSDSHPEVIEILDFLTDFKPRESIAPFAYHGDSMNFDDLPPESELRREEVESIRTKMNAALRGIAAGLDPQSAGDEVQKVLAKYSGSVRLAWTVTENAPYNRVCGYHVTDGLGEGAFSSVWRVEDPVDGSHYALKIMREELTSDRERFDAFRRGVHAMQILESHQAKGMVRFHRAYEIPACVVMEFVDGWTLNEALDNRHITTLTDALRITKQVAAVVGTAHDLPERVLHRDIKPSNVMLRHEAADGSLESRVVVLDFDLSWYEGAFGRSTLLGTHLNNYLAPEQVARHPQFSSHHTAVDVFGLGMLLYYVATGTEPRLNIQDTQPFQSEMLSAIQQRWNARFLATPLYLSQIITAATRTAQDERIGLPAFSNALQAVLAAEQNGRIEARSAFGALELAVRARADGVWDLTPGPLGTNEVHLRSRVGSGRVVVSPAGGTANESWQVRLEYSDEGTGPRSGVAKYLSTRETQAAAILRADGLFRVEATQSGPGTCLVVASSSDRYTEHADIVRLGRALSEAVARLVFD